MTVKLLLVTPLMFLLLGCVHSRSAGSNGSESPVTDLDALASNARRDLAPRTLPNGRLYCMEESRTEKAQDTCGGNLEDTLLESETDKKVGLENVLKGVERIKHRMRPCGFMGRLFNPTECRKPSD